MPANPKTSYEEMLDLFKKVAKDKEDSEKILLTANKLNTLYKTELDRDISNPTLRNYGFCPGGYWETKYPEVFTYKDDGARKYRGMIIDLEELEEKIGLELEEDQEGEEAVA